MIQVTVGRCLLKPILKNKYMTQQNLADLTGMSKQEINTYANDRRKMSLKTAKIIAVALNLHIDDLYEWDVTK
ncbi:MAG: helix-turn-helix transcriptional regulator [Bacillaceae bacterium]